MRVMALFSTSFSAKCLCVGEDGSGRGAGGGGWFLCHTDTDGPGRGHLCHTDTFLVSNLHFRMIS